MPLALIVMLLSGALLVLTLSIDTEWPFYICLVVFVVAALYLGITAGGGSMVYE